MKNLLKITLTLLIGIVMSVGIFRPDMLMGTPASPAIGNWYQQFLPNLNGRQLVDITFTDSLIGYAITSKVSNSSYILKTINGGNNWTILYSDIDSNIFTCLQFLNSNTGYVGGSIRTGFSSRIMKTTNGGLQWTNISTPLFAYQADMFVLNEDTIWYVEDELSSGGIFRTTNGGANWQVQYQGLNPGRIYMYDRNLGFASYNTSVLLRTTNSGVNWIQVSGTEGFTDIEFLDNNTGWKTRGNMKMSTNGGLNWIQQTLPSGGIIINASAINLSVLNVDTLWATGSYVQYPNLQSRGIILRTLDRGNTWLFQIPDTAINSGTLYSYTQFLNSNTGWAYTLLTGIHTTTGGDPIWLTAIEQLSTETPISYKLNQNYPNPFNPVTTIRFEISKQSLTELKIFDITGKQIQVLLKEELFPGVFEVKFDASDLTSGVYFYKLTVTTAKEVFTETKKMILLK